MENVIKKIENHGIKLTVLKSEKNYISTTTKALYNSRYYSIGDTVEVTVCCDLDIQMRGTKRVSCKYCTVDDFISFFLTEETDNSIIEKEFTAERNAVLYDMYYSLRENLKQNKIKFRLYRDLMKIDLRIKNYSFKKHSFLIQLVCEKRRTFEVVNVKTMKSIFDEYTKEEIQQIVNNKMFKKGVCSLCGVTHKEALIRKKDNKDICVYCHYDLKGLY